MDVLGLKSYRWLLIVCYLCWGHGVICVLVQLILAVTQKVIFLPFSVPRVVSNIVRIVCIGYVRNVKKIFLQCINICHEHFRPSYFNV